MCAWQALFESEGSADEAHPLTRDHKGTDKKEAARVTKAGGRIRGGRFGGALAVTRSVGDFQYKENGIDAGLIAIPEVKRVPLHDDERGDCRLLAVCCDGIFDVLSNAKVVTIARSAANKGGWTQRAAQRAAQRIVKAAAQAGSTDDLTAVVVLFSNGQEEEGSPSGRRKKPKKKKRAGSGGFSGLIQMIQEKVESL